MPEIVLATLNAKYIHASFGLRYLLANLGELKARAGIAEFTINERPIDIAERIVALRPRILGLGVYIWNATLSTELVTLLKRIRPEMTIVLGGPEVSHETEGQPIVAQADFVVAGEGDITFPILCGQILNGQPPTGKIIQAPLPTLAEIALPYDDYAADDIAHRLVYVEASRGCPFECEFCLSSLDIPVRQVPLEPFLQAMARLLERGLLHFKFVDRTFNLNLAVSRRILEFFLERLRPGLFLHFEMIPDRLPEGLRELLARFPPGTLQLEVGVQTFNPTVTAAISRRQDYGRLEENFRFLHSKTGVHVHADLIVGLPGETVESFAAGFDRLVALGPQEIQVGILKRLRGTPIARHDDEWQMVYSPMPPYEILRNRLIDFETLQRLRRFARYWDLISNSGNFHDTTSLIWADGAGPFAEFMRLSDWLFAREGKHHAIALTSLMKCVLDYLTEERGLPATYVSEALWRDFQRSGRREVPPFLKAHLSRERIDVQPEEAGTLLPPRQRRHVGSVPHAPP